MILKCKTIELIVYLGFVIFCNPSLLYASSPVALFSDMTDGPVSGWSQSPTKGAAVSIWCKNIGSTRGTSYTQPHSFLQKNG